MDLNEIARKHLQAVYWLHCTTLLRNHFSLFSFVSYFFFSFFFFFGSWLARGVPRQIGRERERERARGGETTAMRTEHGLGLDRIHSGGNNMFALHCLNFTTIYCVMHSLRDSFAKITFAQSSVQFTRFGSSPLRPCACLERIKMVGKRFSLPNWPGSSATGCPSRSFRYCLTVSLSLSLPLSVFCAV